MKEMQQQQSYYDSPSSSQINNRVMQFDEVQIGDVYHQLYATHGYGIGHL
jgi:hypothetical protein